MADETKRKMLTEEEYKEFMKRGNRHFKSQKITGFLVSNPKSVPAAKKQKTSNVVNAAAAGSNILPQNLYCGFLINLKEARIQQGCGYYLDYYVREASHLAKDDIKFDNIGNTTYYSAF
eukprot:2887837-Ditylum_brightwellii.AAC.1